jgi:hypothetical protein
MNLEARWFRSQRWQGDSRQVRLAQAGVASSVTKELPGMFLRRTKKELGVRS